MEISGGQLIKQHKKGGKKKQLSNDLHGKWVCLKGKCRLQRKRDEKEVKKKQMGVKQFVKMASDSGASTWVLVGVGVQCMHGHDIIIIMLNRW